MIASSSMRAASTRLGTPPARLRWARSRNAGTLARERPTARRSASDASSSASAARPAAEAPHSAHRRPKMASAARPVSCWWMMARASAGRVSGDSRSISRGGPAASMTRPSSGCPTAASASQPGSAARRARRPHPLAGQHPELQPEAPVGGEPARSPGAREDPGQGTMIEKGLRPRAWPTARAAPGAPQRAASAP